MKFSCIILAAGSGTRYGEKKQFILLNGKEIWKYSYEAALAVSDDIVVIGVDCEGGKTRQESVKIGLDKIKYNRVVILDAARPLVTSEQIKRIAETDSPSVSYCTPSTDTIVTTTSPKPLAIGHIEGSRIQIGSSKYPTAKGIQYQSRPNCFRLQVPQAFDADKLRRAHAKIDFDATDDCQIMQETYGDEPTLILGGMNLYKLTYPEDLKILEALCK